MALDYITVGISTIILVIYMIIIFLLISIRNRVKEGGSAAIYIILAIILLAVRRIQQVFYEAEILAFVPYLSDIIVFLFALLILLSVFSMHRTIKNLENSKKRR